MKKGLVLLIEDNKFQAKKTIAILESAGYDVIWEVTGMAGFKAAKTQPPDIILLDVVLPDRDGNEICRFIKMDDEIRNIPVIMLSVRTKLKDRLKGLNIGADDYLSKPFNEKELIARINAFLRIKALQDQLQAKNQQLEEVLKTMAVMATTDYGTGLYNRRHFFELMDKEMSRVDRFKAPLTCMLIDIDHFKKVNDTYGHLVGDSVLMEIGTILRNEFREIETAARYGGEEFVMLLPGTTLSEAKKPALRLLEKIRKHSFKGCTDGRPITISIGLGGIPDPEIKTREDLIRCADHALYRAKHAGRNRIEIATGKESNGPPGLK